MTWVFAILVVLAMGGVAAVAAGRGSGLAPEDEEPAGPRAQDVALDATGLRSVRFGLALRGYRMADVDALLDRLAVREEQRAQDERTPGEPDQPGQEGLSDR